MPLMRPSGPTPIGRSAVEPILGCWIRTKTLWSISGRSVLLRFRRTVVVDDAAIFVPYAA